MFLPKMEALFLATDQKEAALYASILISAAILHNFSTVKATSFVSALRILTVLQLTASTTDNVLFIGLIPQRSVFICYHVRWLDFIRK